MSVCRAATISLAVLLFERADNAILNHCENSLPAPSRGGKKSASVAVLTNNIRSYHCLLVNSTWDQKESVRALLFDFGPDLVRSSFEAMENQNSAFVRIFIGDTRPQGLHILDRRYAGVDEPCVRRFETLLWGEATRFCGLIC